MEIIIAATKSCNHRPLLEKELKNAGLHYKVMYFEEHPEIFEKYELKTSPLLIVDDELVSAGMPEHSIIKELRDRL